MPFRVQVETQFQLGALGRMVHPLQQRGFHLEVAVLVVIVLGVLAVLWSLDRQMSLLLLERETASGVCAESQLAGHRGVWR